MEAVTDTDKEAVMGIVRVVDPGTATVMAMALAIAGR